MLKRLLTMTACAMVGAAGIAATSAAAQNVKITPLGSHEGEFCRFDRAMIFEDPDGTRLLYDAGRTVQGPNDPPPWQDRWCVVEPCAWRSSR